MNLANQSVTRWFKRVTAALIWILATGLAWLAYFVMQLFAAVFTWGANLDQTLFCLVPFTLLIPFLMGVVQGRIIRNLGQIAGQGWHRRTVIGWVIGLIAMWLIFYGVEKVYHYVPTEFGWGYLVVHG